MARRGVVAAWLRQISRNVVLAAIRKSRHYSTLELRFDRCKAVHDYTPVSLLKGLEELGINNCGEIATISFLGELPNLEHFSFVETNVVDGNLIPCVEHRKLKHVGFTDKRQYSHRFDDLKRTVKRNSNGNTHSS